MPTTFLLLASDDPPAVMLMSVLIAMAVLFLIGSALSSREGGKWGWVRPAAIMLLGGAVLIASYAVADVSIAQMQIGNWVIGTVIWIAAAILSLLAVAIGYVLTPEP
jgi:Na+-transporting NADH:ubiquinone oxidoreductase subunit NqrB